MVEEKKEEKSETPSTEAPAAEKPSAETPAADAPKAEAKPPVKKEKPSTCAQCNKSIKNKRWYYRNGKFFCTKRCWKATVKKEEKEAEAAGPNT